ncbi:hypothetical protein ACSSS7_005666 [Eimeria intestinalis]
MAEDNKGGLPARHLKARGGLGPRPTFVKLAAFTSSSNCYASPMAASAAYEDSATRTRPQDTAGCCRLVRGAPNQRPVERRSQFKSCMATQGRAMKSVRTRGTNTFAASSLMGDPAPPDGKTLPQMHTSAHDSSSIDVQASGACERADHDALTTTEAPRIRAQHKGPLPLYGHLLSSILAHVGDTPQEKSRLAFVSKDWRAALGVHTAWPSVNVTHRPISSLLKHAGHLKRLFAGTETLSLAEGDTPHAGHFLIQLAEAKPTLPREGPSFSFSNNLSMESNTESSTASLTSSSSSKEWMLPSLRRLRIHKCLGAGYISYVTPNALYDAMDSMPLKGGSSLQARNADGGGLQLLEELVVECEVGAEVLLALTGRTPRLRSLVIAQLAADPSIDEKEFGGDAQATKGRVTNFEALLLLLQSLPPQQLQVFGLNTALRRYSTTYSAAGNACAPSLNSLRTTDERKGEATTLQAALLDIRKRLEERRRTGFREEAEGDELLSLLTQQQNETLSAIWTPHVEPSFVALQALKRSSKNLKYCSVPGASVIEYLRL